MTRIGLILSLLFLSYGGIYSFLTSSLGLRRPLGGGMNSLTSPTRSPLHHRVQEVSFHSVFQLKDQANPSLPSSSSPPNLSSTQTERFEDSVDGKRSSSLVKLFYRASWVSWWVQVILTVIAGVILTFANTVRQSAMKESAASIWMSGFAFSVLSSLISSINCFWTWNTARSCTRLMKVEPKKTIQTLKRYCRIAVGISLVGLFANIIGAEQITGNLASKVLSAQTLGGLLTTNQVSNAFQPLDIFLVQANTNVLVAHFASLLCYILLQTQLH